MQLNSINYWAVLVVGIIQMVLGALWYGPLFGKPWMAMMGFTKEGMEAAKKGMGARYGAMFVATLVMAYVLAHFGAYAGATTFVGGMQLGFWVWLGFYATSMLGMVLWEKKPFKLYVLNTGYYLVSLMLMGGVLMVWR